MLPKAFALWFRIEYFLFLDVTFIHKKKYTRLNLFMLVELKRPRELLKANKPHGPAIYSYTPSYCFRLSVVKY